MYRNDYDTDVTTWAPQGRLWQVTYAMEAVKQGSVCLGMSTKDIAVLGGFKRCVCVPNLCQLPIFRVFRFEWCCIVTAVKLFAWGWSGRVGKGCFVCCGDCVRLDDRRVACIGTDSVGNSMSGGVQFSF